jgi:cell division septation protein DedD
MKKSNILLATSTIALLATGCVKPTQDGQAIYDPAQPAYGTTTQQSGTYEEATTYDPSAPGIIYEGAQSDNPVITTGTATQQAIGGVTTYPDYGSTTTAATTTTYPDYGSTTAATMTYPNTYGSSTATTTTTTYPDPYASTTTGTTTTYPDPYTSQVTTNYPATTSSSAGQSGGIQLQIAALKDYYTAEDYKNRLTLAPGLSAYVKRGAMNKVIITGIPSVAEANRLKESRFPGAFIVHGSSTSGSYTPTVQPNYSTTYSVNNPYGTSSSTYASGNSGTGVQVGAFSTRRKAQSVANAQTGRYPATVKKIGRLYKVILTGFSSRSAAKSYARRVGGFVVSTY